MKITYFINCIDELFSLQSNSKDYTNVPYDRGHMAPAADFICSPDIRDATFTMANICPQVGHYVHFLQNSSILEKVF